ncbi:uncharacterized protein LOC128235291 [Mya arenaria]|uniref:uncharacterized protein LOC128235291 n=1 Tax=Mya arenaria TaxID=6604 RepID=UPI0022E0AA41|nr:uncharacterized protein LOC128235291 [Mya arenaria]
MESGLVIDSVYSLAKSDGDDDVSEINECKPGSPQIREEDLIPTKSGEDDSLATDSGNEFVDDYDEPLHLHDWSDEMDNAAVNADIDMNVSVDEDSSKWYSEIRERLGNSPEVDFSKFIDIKSSNASKNKSRYKKQKPIGSSSKLHFTGEACTKKAPHKKTHVDMDDAPPVLENMDGNEGVETLPFSRRPPVLMPEIQCDPDVQPPQVKKRRCSKIDPCYIVLSNVGKIVANDRSISLRTFKRVHTECSNMCKKTHFKRRLSAGEDVFNVKTPSKQKDYQRYLEEFEDTQRATKRGLPYTLLTDLLKKHDQKVKKRIGSPDKRYPNRVRRTFARLPHDFKEVDTQSEKGTPEPQEKLLPNVAKPKDTVLKERALWNEKRENDRLRALATLSKLVMIKRKSGLEKKKIKMSRAEAKKFIQLDGTKSKHGRIRKSNSRYNTGYALDTLDILEYEADMKMKHQLKQSKQETDKQFRKGEEKHQKKSEKILQHTIVIENWGNESSAESLTDNINNSHKPVKFHDCSGDYVKSKRKIPSKKSQGTKSKRTSNGNGTSKNAYHRMPNTQTTISDPYSLRIEIEDEIRRTRERMAASEIKTKRTDVLIQNTQSVNDFIETVVWNVPEGVKIKSEPVEFPDEREEHLSEVIKGDASKSLSENPGVTIKTEPIETDDTSGTQEHHVDKHKNSKTTEAFGTTHDSKKLQADLEEKYKMFKIPENVQKLFINGPQKESISKESLHNENTNLYKAPEGGHGIHDMQKKMLMIDRPQVKHVQVVQTTPKQANQYLHFYTDKVVVKVPPDQKLQPGTVSLLSQAGQHLQKLDKNNIILSLPPSSTSKAASDSSQSQMISQFRSIPNLPSHIGLKSIVPSQNIVKSTSTLNLLHKNIVVNSQFPGVMQPANLIATTPAVLGDSNTSVAVSTHFVSASGFNTTNIASTPNAFGGINSISAPKAVLKTVYSPGTANSTILVNSAPRASTSVASNLKPLNTIVLQAPPVPQIVRTPVAKPSEVAITSFVNATLPQAQGADKQAAGNGKLKFFLLKVEGKNILIPMDVSTQQEPKAYIMSAPNLSTNNVVTTISANKTASVLKTDNKMTVIVPSSATLPATYASPGTIRASVVSTSQVPTAVQVVMPGMSNLRPMLPMQPHIIRPMVVPNTTVSQSNVHTIPVMKQQPAIGTIPGIMQTINAPLLKHQLLNNGTTSVSGMNSNTVGSNQSKSNTVPHKHVNKSQIKTVTTHDANGKPLTLAEVLEMKRKSIKEAKLKGSSGLQESKQLSLPKQPNRDEADSATQKSKRKSLHAPKTLIEDEHDTFNERTVRVLNPMDLQQRVNNKGCALKVVHNASSYESQSNAAGGKSPVSHEASDEGSSSPKAFTEGISAREERLRKLKELLKEKQRAVEDLKMSKPTL